MRNQHREQGFSMAFFALFMAFIAIPLTAVAVDLTRYVWVRSVLQRAADAAAESAALEADIACFQATGETRFNANALPEAIRMASTTVSPLVSSHVYPSLDYLELDETQNTVRVGLSATTRLLVAAGLTGTTIRVEGTSQLRLREN